MDLHKLNNGIKEKTPFVFTSSTPVVNDFLFDCHTAGVFLF